MILQSCDYVVTRSYDAALNGTATSLSFAGIQIDGVSYTDVTNPDFENQAAIQAFLDNLSLGTFTYVYTGGVGTFTFNDTTIVPEIVFLIEGITTMFAGPVELIVGAGADCKWFYDTNIVRGCTDPLAANYNAAAQEDDGGCRYTPLDNVGKIRCCVATSSYIFEKKRLAGMTAEKERCCAAQNWYNRKAVKILESFIAIGTAIKDPVEVADEVMASCIIDFYALLGDVLYLELEASTDGVVVFPALAGFIGGPYATWLTLQAFVTAFVAWVNGDNTVPEYTATNVGMVVTLLPAMGLGASVNGLLTNLLGNAIKYSYRNIYQTNPLTVITPNFGCYDYDRDEIWFGGLLTNLATVMDGAGNVLLSLSFPYNTGQVIYNPKLQRKYVAMMNGPYLARIDNTNAIIPGSLTVGGHGGEVYYGAYNPITETFAYTCCSTNVDNAVVIYNANTEGIVYDVALLASDNVREIAYNPSAGAYQGYYAAACISPDPTLTFSRVALVSPAGVLSYITFTLAVQPIVVSFIENYLGAGAGVYEMWVAGTGPSILRFDAATMAYIGLIATPVAVTCRSIKQHPLTGDIYVANDSANAQVFIIRASDGVFINPGMVISNLPQGAYDIIIHPVTGLAYLSMPYGGDNKIVELTTIEVDIDADYPFAGGADAILEAIPGIYSTEDDNCLTEEENVALEQEMLDRCSKCCD